MDAPDCRSGGSGVIARVRLAGTGAFLFERQLGWGVIGVVVFAFCIGGLGNILAGVLFLRGSDARNVPPAVARELDEWGGVFFGGWLVFLLGAALYDIFGGW